MAGGIFQITHEGETEKYYKYLESSFWPDLVLKSVSQSGRESFLRLGQVWSLDWDDPAPFWLVQTFDDVIMQSVGLVLDNNPHRSQISWRWSFSSIKKTLHDTALLYKLFMYINKSRDSLINESCNIFSLWNVNIRFITRYENINKNVSWTLNQSYKWARTEVSLKTDGLFFTIDIYEA